MEETYKKHLVDRRIQLKMQMEQLKEQLDNLDEEIKEDFEPGEVILGSDGYGYKIGVTEKLVYGKNVIKALKERDLLDSFVTLSTGKLERLAKERKLSYAELDAFRESAEVKQTKTILQFMPDEARIV